MPDPVTNNFSFTLPTQGGDTNVWGTLLNNGVITAIDSTLGSNLAVSITTTDVTLTDAQMQNAIFIVSGALTGNRNLIIPLSPNSATDAVGGRFVVVNNTTGNFTLSVITAASGSVGVTIPQGFTAFVYSDETNVGYCTFGLPAMVEPVVGDPNGQLAGTAGSVNTNTSLAWDTTNNILYACITGGDNTHAVWINTAASTSNLPSPQGYLTPVSGTPIITGDSIGATAIFYTPFKGAQTPIHNGVTWVPFTFAELPLTLSPSQASNNLYDIFLAYNGGTPVIGTGPSWSGGSGGSIAPGSCERGIGAGGTALTRNVQGLLVNAADIQMIFNTGTGNHTITVPAGQGLWLGTGYIDATAGQITCHRSVGQSRKWGLSNGWNQVETTLQVSDPTANWLYTSATIRPSNNNTANSFTSLDGLGYGMQKVNFNQNVRNSAPLFLTMNIGIGFNSTTAFSGKFGTCGFGGGNNNIATEVADFVQTPQLGINVYTCLEQSTGNAGGTQQFDGSNQMLMRGSWLV